MTEKYVEGIKQYHDMKIWLLLAGGLQIFIGVFFFFIGIMSVFGVLIQSVSQSATSSLEMAIGGMVFYILLSACMIFLGVGTIMCRKWARAMGAAGWGVALVWGVIGMVYFFLLLSEYPKMIPQQPAGGGPPMQDIMAVVMLVMGIIISIFTIGIPTLFFFFFSNRHVRMTCEDLDRNKRWTDAVPLPILPMLIILVTFLSSIIMMPFYSFTVPFFGKFLQGWEGAGILLICVVIAVFLVKTLYKLKSYAWYITLLSGIIITSSTLTTFVKADLADLYTLMGYPEPQIELMMKMDLQTSIITSISLTFICFIVYMFWIKKHFKSDTKKEVSS